MIVARRNSDSADGIGSFMQFAVSGVWFGVCPDEFVASQTVHTGTNVWDGQWHHVVGVYEAGSSVAIYLDGVKADEFTTSVFASQNHRVLPVTIGCRAFGYYFRDDIDEVRIYSRALSSQEVVALYEKERPRAKGTSAKSPETGLVLHYTFDEWDGARVIDGEREGQNSREGPRNGTDGGSHWEGRLPGSTGSATTSIAGAIPLCRSRGISRIRSGARPTRTQNGMLVCRRNGDTATGIASTLMFQTRQLTLNVCPELLSSRSRSTISPGRPTCAATANGTTWPAHTIRGSR